MVQQYLGKTFATVLKNPQTQNCIRHFLVHFGIFAPSVINEVKSKINFLFQRVSDKADEIDKIINDAVRKYNIKVDGGSALVSGKWNNVDIHITNIKLEMKFSDFKKLYKYQENLKSHKREAEALIKDINNLNGDKNKFKTIQQRYTYLETKINNDLQDINNLIEASTIK